MAVQQRKNSNKNNAALQAANNHSKRKTKQKQQPSLFLSVRGSRTKSIFSSSTIQASLVLMVAAGVAVFWNWYEGSSYGARPNDPLVVRYLSSTCQSKLPLVDDGNQDPQNATPNHYCHAALVPLGRTHVARRRIRPGETLVIIPRSRQIWDLDALRDDVVRNELLPARHSLTDNPLDGGAFLAAYMALLLVLEDDDVVHPPNETNNNNNLNTSPRKRQQQRHASYLRYLPNISTLEQTHPTLWSLEDEIVPLVGRFSSSYSVVRAYQEMLESEYFALAGQSPLFGGLVSESVYRQMRLAVMSRSFGPGPPTSAELPKRRSNEESGKSTPEFHSIEEEMDYYAQVAGVNLTLGCRAMVPILDLYNHHVHPNVDWKYDVKRRSFVVQANAAHGIAVGQELYDTYGRFTDSHLWARYGFVNGDGSEYTQATIAMFHRILDLDLKQQFSYLPVDKTPLDPSLIHVQRRDLTRYLQFDDGYDECVQQSNNPQGFEMKRLQLEYLLRIANHPRHWIVRMPPREPKAMPHKVSHEPNPDLVPPAITAKSAVAFDFSKVMETCRIIAMTYKDYNGTAMTILEEALNSRSGTSSNHGGVLDPPPPVPKGDASLEFRSLVCTGRMAIVALGRFPHSVEEEMKLIQQSEFQSKNWTAAHLRLGEMQTLEVLRDMTFVTAKRFRSALEQASPDGKLPVVREKPCPWEYTGALLEDVTEEISQAS